jgi:hypothetical protein
VRGRAILVATLVAAVAASCAVESEDAPRAATSPTGSFSPSGPAPTDAPSPEALEPILLEPLPDQGVVVGHPHAVELVALDGRVIQRLDGFRLYYQWTVPGPVILRRARVFYLLDARRHRLDPFPSRAAAFEAAPPFQDGYGPESRSAPIDRPADTEADVGFWAFALPSRDGSMLLAEWSGECESQTAFLARGDGTDPVPVTGEAGLAGAPASSVLGWYEDGALVALGTSECGGAGPVAGVYLFPGPGAGTLLFRIPDLRDARMWGAA